MTAAPAEPVFLVGAERSGTTMLRLMLDHHPQISWINEFEYTVDRVSPDGAGPDLGEYREWLSTHRVYLASGFEIRGETYRDVVRDFLRQRLERSGKPIVGATVHRGFQQLAAIWSQARYIHLVRDPRDVARSVVAMGWAGNVWHGAREWAEVEQELGGLLPRLGTERVFELRYEDLLAAPEGMLRRLCDFVGVAYSPEALSYPDDTSYEAPDASLAWQWRRKLSERDVRLVEARVGPLLIERGYEPSGLPALEVTPAMRRRLGRQDRAYCVRFRLRRLGPRLFLADQLTRRLGMARLHKGVKLRINEVTRRHLR
jgi:hypothetical protein